jgi:hypothetical protein
MAMKTLAWCVSLGLLIVLLGCSGGGGGGGGDSGTGSDGGTGTGGDGHTGTSSGGDGGTGGDSGGTGGTDDPSGTTGSGTDTDCTVDVDHDGYCHPDDCDDENPGMNPGQDEICGNAFDDNCDGTVDEGCLDGTTPYFVDKDSIGGGCSDDNPGTETEPWCTIAKANSTLTAGDTVYIRAGTYTGETIQPANAGLSDTERITYTAFEDEVVTFGGSVYCIRLDGTSYVTILGLEFLDCERNLYISASSHNNIGHCEFDNPGGPTTWAGSRIYDGSTYNRIYRSVFSRYGEETYYDDSYQDSGCILDIGSDNEVDDSAYNLIVDSTFFYGGHHILGVYSNYNVVRDNTFHNEEWYPCNRAEIGGMCGNRNVILNTSTADANIRNVIEDNKIAFSGVPPDQVASAGMSMRTQLNIVRRNAFYHCDGAGLGLSANAGNSNDASNNHVYNNVFYRNGYLLFDDWDPRKTGMMLARWEDIPGYNAMVGVAIKNNIFHENQLHAIYYYYVDEAAQSVAGNWEEEGDPGFVDISGTADPFDFDVFDFRLQASSPCVDGGVFLTETTNAAQDATVLEVDNAGYFTDGFGLIEGDMIQLEGQDVAVVITGIDYDANTITVDVPLSWEAGTGVGLPYFGSSPDQGMQEHGP